MGAPEAPGTGRGRRVETQELGAREGGGGEEPLFLPTPSFMASTGEE